MFFIARICSVVRALELLCVGVSIVSMGVWVLGESLGPAMVVTADFEAWLSEGSNNWFSVSQALYRPGNIWLNIHT